MKSPPENQSDGLSLILPIFNEEESIPDVLTEVVLILRGLDRPFEIICVNDGSTDAGPTLLKEASRSEVPEIRLVSFRRNQGQSAAFAAGFQVARFPWIITMDADGQNDPADIPKMLEAIGDADICCGYRAERKDSWSKRYGSRIGNSVRRRLLNSEVKDTGCSLKLFRSTALEGMPLWKGMHRFYPDLCRIYNHTRMVQVPVHHRPRLKGSSKYTNVGRLFKTLPDALAVRWMMRRTLSRQALDMEEE